MRVVERRPRLIGLAYRLLGSMADAEDVVQETYSRWYAMPAEERDAIAEPGGWLTTVASRICLDMLGSARWKRERYTGEWIPEPLPGGAEKADPADRVTLDESITMAFLVVLEQMTPAERVAFILHDVFGYPFAEIARIVGRTPAACRKLASLGRQRLSTGTRRKREPEHADVVRQVKLAWEAHDIGALVTLLDPGATAVVDGGGKANSAMRPIVGGEQVARYLVQVAEWAPDLTILEREVNGRPGLVAQRDGVTLTVAAIDVTGGRVTRIWGVRNPDKLRLWTPADG